MRQVILYTALLCYATGSFAQNNFRQPMPATASQPNDPWDLTKNVWSHTNYKTGKADKPVIDFEAIENWQTIGSDNDVAISSDGKYFAYSIQSSLNYTRDTIVVQSTMTSWRQAFAGARPGFFSADNRRYVFQDKDNLCFLQAGTDQLRMAEGVASHQQPPGSKGEWLAYQLKNKEATLVLENLLNEKTKRFDGVSAYSFDPSGTWLAVQLNNAAKELVICNLATGKEQRFASVAGFSFDAHGQVLVVKTNTSLLYATFPDGATSTIWQVPDSNTQVAGFSLDRSGRQVVFAIQQPSVLPDQPNISIWYYQAGMNKAVLKVNNQTLGIGAGLFIQGIPSFTWLEGRYIRFSLQQQPENLSPPDPEAVKVDVWSYQDTVLQSTQSYLLKQPARTYAAIIHPKGTRVIRLEQEYETLGMNREDFAIIEKNGQGVNGDRFWKKGYSKDSIWLVSLKDGNRMLLKIRQREACWFSPDGHYLVYFDPEQGFNYYSYHLSTGKVVNISAGIPAGQLGTSKGMDDYYERPPVKTRIVGIAAWLEHDEGLLVYDEYYDIWQLDLAGKKLPLNITSGLGRKQHIRLRLPEYKLQSPLLTAKDTILLVAFNNENKQTGIYRKVLGIAADPEKLYMGACLLEPVLQGDLLNGINYKPLKAAHTNAWILKRQSVDEAPNYFLTGDFKTYQPLTDLQPHKKYNWYTAEIHRFKQPDGTMSQGILYKPENFDPAKKYPALIVFYGTLTNGLYEYKKTNYMTSPSSSKESPAWMVSHGYLVFTPDIYFKKGQWGPSALNTVEGAAKYLSTLPFVDGKKLGACGHSNSGLFGYYILTHSNTFAAMSIGAGSTNVIGGALSLKSHWSSMELLEVTMFGGGLGNLWQNKDSWLDHTSVLHADKVTSPSLLFHNKNDGVRVEHAVAMFTALRRLEKKTWWLQYDEGAHTVRARDAKDFTIRYTQFFDHYLKEAPAPRWMTSGIPAKLKGIESRYDLTREESCGPKCPVCHKSNIVKAGK